MNHASGRCEAANGRGSLAELPRGANRLSSGPALFICWPLWRLLGAARCCSGVRGAARKAHYYPTLFRRGESGPSGARDMGALSSRCTTWRIGQSSPWPREQRDSFT